MYAFLALWIGFVASPSLCTTYYPMREHSGATFFDGWNYYGSWDNLTLANVIYLNETTAYDQRLTYVNEAGNAIVRVDNFTDVAINQTRNSIRLESKDLYDKGSLWIFDALHIPFGCSVWPAFWAKGDDWPNGGEIDIVEAINLMERNQVALHTTPGCMKANTSNVQLGQTLELDCSTAAGCVVAESKDNSYGKDFADNGGGVFATQFEASGINIWFWPRSSVPQSISESKGEALTDLADWGTPTASYADDSCNIDQFFTPQRLVLNIALCGIWAGPAFKRQGKCGKGTCEDYITGPGSPKFDEAYFEVKSVRTYTTASSIPSATWPASASKATNGAPSSGTPALHLTSAMILLFLLNFELCLPNMRATVPRHSDMPGLKNAWNVWWGDKHGLVKQKGIVTYGISPFQVSPTRHMVRGWLFNGTSRIAAQAPYFVVPFVIGYGVYAWAKKFDEYQNSKAGHIASGGHH
ncbi:hypothetical protein ONZ45_g1811 [Pleurotus djamor]|nr:hypothetical protein ONZ45_g1811 [Pleurotus djamor]